MLNKLFLMSNRLVTSVEGAVNAAEQVVSHEEEIHYFCRRSDKC